jgi:hypothetical protein
MTEREFHAARRMFAAHKGTVLVCRPGHPVSHVEWLIDVFGYVPRAEMWMTMATRGYVLGDRLVAYKGADFSHWVDHDDLVAALTLLDVNGTTIQTIGLGAKAGPDNPWPARIEMSKDEYFASLAQRRAGG